MSLIIVTGKSLTFIISSLTPGGAERIISELSNQMVSTSYQIEVIVLSKQPHFFKIHPEIRIHEPDFTIQQMSRLAFKWRNFWWLRKRLIESHSKAFLSFGGKYNAFVLLAAIGLSKRIFISDRSRPGISYGKFLDFLNPWVYQLASGIIAQTSQANEFAKKQTGHNNIEIIPNPISSPHEWPNEKQPVVLNVGRFITSKHQNWLIHYFNEIQPEAWKLIFLGDGNLLEQVKDYAEKSEMNKSIFFKGNVKGIEKYYSESAIFAFTSTSEGFPNALAEAMAHGCACISFDCVAGPSDLIDDGVNGFLIPQADHQQYQEKLKLLIQDEQLRNKFCQAAREKVKQFDVKAITHRYLDFMLKE